MDMECNVGITPVLRQYRDLVSDLCISKHKALSKFVKESVAEDQSVGAGTGTEGPGIPDVERALLATKPHSCGHRSRRPQSIFKQRRVRSDDAIRRLLGFE
jgi:hypothetical protein